VDREILVRDTLPLVERVASSLASRLPPQVEISDLTQAGFLGLLDAAQKFDWDKGVRFSTYAELRIRGAILDSLRALDWVPRSLRRRRRELASARSLLATRLGREPSEEELASQMNLSVSQLRVTAERVFRSEVASDASERVDRVEPDHSDPTALDPQKLLERRELEILVARAVESLTERERRLLTLYYQEERTMKEVGALLGVNESRVSQIHSKIIAKLRRRMRRELRPRPAAALARSA
jgi:RNA polymerase sigma factor for flagellar operon FliA